MAVIRGFLIETLFDFMQACQFRDRASTIKLVHYDCGQKMTLPPSIGFHPSDIWQQTVQVWTAWNRAGLAQHSPNLTPIIQDVAALKQQTSPTVYQNLTQCLNSERTIRDLAIQLKQHALLLMRSLLPYVRQGIIRLVTVTDIAVPAYPTDNVAAQPLDGQTKRPLVAYLEDSRFDRMAMGQILRQAGYRFTGMSDPLQALPQIIEQKPDLIFLDVLMPVLNGYEVCARIRQISAFKHTPVIFVTSCDGIADRARAKLLGASGFLTKPITSEKVLANLWNYLLKSASPPIQPINQGPQSLVSPPTPIRRSRGKVIEEGRRIQAFT
ncbi:MAG: response regulator [Cyanobacteria bacterium J06639_14]